MATEFEFIEVPFTQILASLTQLLERLFHLIQDFPLQL